MALDPRLTDQATPPASGLDPRLIEGSTSYFRETPAPPAPAPKPPGLGDYARLGARGLFVEAPLQAASTVAGMIEGAEGVEPSNPDVGDKIRGFARRSGEEFSQDVTDTLGTGFRSELVQAIPSLGYSAATLPVTAAATALGAAGAGLVGLPTGPGAVGSAIAGGAAGLAAGYVAMDRAAQAQILGDLAAQEETRLGRPLTEEEFTTFKAGIDEKVAAYGGWEAGPEALSNVIDIALFKKFPGFGGIAKKALGLVATELPTETVTQIGQSQALEGTSQARPDGPLEFTSPTDVVTAGREVLPGVLVVGGGMTLASTAIDVAQKKMAGDTTEVDASRQRALDVLKFKTENPGVALSDEEVAGFVAGSTLTGAQAPPVVAPEVVAPVETLAPEVVAPAEPAHLTREAQMRAERQAPAPELLGLPAQELATPLLELAAPVNISLASGAVLPAQQFYRMLNEQLDAKAGAMTKEEVIRSRRRLMKEEAAFFEVQAIQAVPAEQRTSAEKAKLTKYKTWLEPTVPAEAITEQKELVDDLQGVQARGTQEQPAVQVLRGEGGEVTSVNPLTVPPEQGTLPENQSGGSMPTSWVVKNKETGEVVRELYGQDAVDKLNTEKYEAVPIKEHLASLGPQIKNEPSPQIYDTAPAPESGGAGVQNVEVPKTAKGKFYVSPTMYTKNEWTLVDGEKVSVEGAPAGAEFFAHKIGKTWEIAEVNSGGRVGTGSSKKDALASAMLKFAAISPEQGAKAVATAPKAPYKGSTSAPAATLSVSAGAERLFGAVVKKLPEVATQRDLMVQLAGGSAKLDGKTEILDQHMAKAVQYVRNVGTDPYGFTTEYQTPEIYRRKVEVYEAAGLQTPPKPDRVQWRDMTPDQQKQAHKLADPFGRIPFKDFSRIAENRAPWYNPETLENVVPNGEESLLAKLKESAETKEPAEEATAVKADIQAFVTANPQITAPVELSKALYEAQGNEAQVNAEYQLGVQRQAGENKEDFRKRRHALYATFLPEATPTKEAKMRAERQKAKKSEEAAPAEPTPAKVKAPAEVKGETKELWQTPFKEAYQSVENELIRNSATGLFPKYHRNSVVKALAEGKPVPAEVLADYPELKPVPPAKEAKMRAERRAKKATSKEAPSGQSTPEANAPVDVQEVPQVTPDLPRLKRGYRRSTFSVADPGLKNYAFVEDVSPKGVKTLLSKKTGEAEFKAVTPHVAGLVAKSERSDVKFSEGETDESTATAFSRLPERDRVEFLARTANATDTDVFGGGPGKVSTDGVLARRLESIAGLFGHHVTLLDGVGYKHADGFVSSFDDTTLYVYADAKDPHIVVLGHELVHQVRVNSPELYLELEGAIAELRDDKTLQKYFNDYYVRSIEGLTVSESGESTGTISNKVVEEWVAEFVGRNFTSETFWQDFAEARPSLAVRIAEAVHDFVAALRDKLFNAKATERTIKDVRAAEKATAKILAKYSALRTSTPIDTLSTAIAQETGVPVAQGTFTQVPAPRGQEAVYQALAKVLKKEIVFFKAWRPPMTFNGVTGILEGTIFVNIDSTKPHLVITGHEFLHDLKKEEPETYAALRDVVLDIIPEKDRLKMWAGLNAKRASEGRQPVDMKSIEEEMVADFFGEQFTSKEFWAKVERRNPEGFAALVQRLVDFLGRMAQVFTGAERADILRAQDAAAEALARYVRKNPEAGYEVKLSEGWHAGDLGYGVDTVNGRMTSGRGSGHFGTGVYFVSTKEKLGDARADRPTQSVDFDAYKLLTPRTEDKGFAIHKALKVVNDMRAFAADMTPEREAKLKAAVMELSYALPGEWYDNQYKLGTLAKAAITDAAQDFKFTSTEYSDSASTRLLKALGYEGVDVRHLPQLDNTTYGSVIFSRGLGTADPRFSEAPKRNLTNLRESLTSGQVTTAALPYVLKATPFSVLVDSFKKTMPQLPGLYRLFMQQDATTNGIVTDFALHAKELSLTKAETAKLVMAAQWGTIYQMRSQNDIYAQDWIPAAMRNAKDTKPETKEALLKAAQTSWEAAGMQTSTGKTFREAYADARAAYDTLGTDKLKADYLHAVKMMSKLQIREKDAAIALIEAVTQVTAEMSTAQADELTALRTTQVDAINEAYATLKGNYWPVYRKGRYVLTYVDKALGVPAREQFSTIFERDMAAKALISNDLADEATMKLTVADEMAPGSFGVPAGYNTALGKAIEDKAIADATRGLTEPAEIDAAAENARQMAQVTIRTMQEVWLKFQPEASAGKNLMRRKNVLGWDTDMVRGFLEYGQTHAVKVAQMEVGRKIEQTLNDINTDLKGRGGDTSRERTVLNDLRAREAARRSMPSGEWAKHLGAWTTFKYMTSPSIALVQMTQLGILTLPRLATLRVGGKEVGATAAGNALRQGVQAAFSQKFTRKAMYGDGTVGRIAGNLHAVITTKLRADNPGQFDNIPLGTPLFSKAEQQSMVNALNPYQKKLLALHEAMARNILDISLSHDAQDQIGGADPLSLKGRVFNHMMVWMRESEKASRKAAILAAFEVGGGQTDFFAGMETVTEVVDNTLFNYAKFAKGTLLQGDLMRVLTTFQTFRINALAKMLVLFNQTLKSNGATTEERGAAKKELIGIFGMSGVLAGVVGMPFSSVIFGLLDRFVLDDDDEPAKKQFENWVAEYFGETVAAVATKGLPSLLGTDLSRRIGLGNLGDMTGVLGETQAPPRLTGDGALNWYATQGMGPAYSMVAGYAKGFNEIVNEGEVMKGLVSSTPKPISDVLKAYGYATEGVKTGAGKRLLDAEQVSPHEAVLQAFGFASFEIARVKEQAFMESNIGAKMSLLKGQKIQDFAKAFIDGEGTEDERASVLEFNKSYPLFAIASSDLSGAVRKYKLGDLGIDTPGERRVKMQIGR